MSNGTCGQKVRISGMNHLVFACHSEPGHAGPCSIAIGPELMRRIKQTKERL